MAEFGKKLREAREQQGFSIEDVEEETKIRKLYIKALEDEEFSVLPPLVYANGFVKSYASFLNLNPEELSGEFKELVMQHEDFEELPPMPVTPPPKEPLMNKMPVRNIFLAAVFLIVAIWAGNFLVTYFTGDTDQPDVNKPPVEENRVEPPRQGENSTPAPVPPSVIDEFKLTVKIKPQQKSWILIKADGQEVYQGILTENQEQSFTAKDLLYIKAGNAGAVEIYINEKLQEPLGGVGEVWEKEFKNDDYRKQ
ncbi:Domain of unknown function DUF4115 [Syntrophomonas zehnderi OL-4]|uniref:Cytoskeleton protein RodZ-like C-terminal domain-containing protein n=1 Tax=Syntrophomonas zehnderi OL-4 TaxID=690567 RepID=A0A0E4GB22_9FIRM|nr:RodZ domain-containing protein [Syntrophomonas zehnderi]CFX75968.1 Domain of unknown function DUF4115 [Syntrophomonas zehnderi OL-4]